MMKNLTFPNWRDQLRPLAQAAITRLPIPILLAGTFLRMAGLASSSLWFDETYSLAMTRLSLLDNVRLQMEAHSAPLWEIVAWLSVRLVGENLWAVRLPALMFSLVGLALAWQIVTTWIPAGHPGRLAAAVLLGLLPYQFWMAQDGRVYSLYVALYLGFLWFGFNRRWVGMAACGALVVYAHITGIFYLVGGLIVIDWFHPTQRRPLTITTVTIGLALLPRIPEYLGVVSGTENYWMPPLEWPGWFASLAMVTFSGAIQGILAILAAGLVSVCMVLACILSISDYLNDADRDRRMLALGAAGLLPILLMVIPSTQGTNVVIYRTLSPAMVVLCIWFAGVLTPRRITFTSWVLPYTWLLLVVIGLICWNPTVRGAQLQAVAERINRQWQDGDLVLHASSVTWLPFSAYLDHPGVILDEPATPGELSNAMQAALHIPHADPEDLSYRRIWVIQPEDPRLGPSIEQRLSKLTEGARFIDRLNYLQIAPVDIYLQEGN